MDGQRSKIDVAFAEWMRLHLGYHDTELRIHVRGNRSSEYRVSVHGRAYDPRWRLANVFAVAALVVAAVIENSPWHTSTNTTSALMANGAGLLALVSFLVGYYGKKRTQRHAWVQCKDVDRRITRRDVEKLQGAALDARRTPSAKWIPSEVLLVSGAAGFDVEALNAAESCGIVCFQQVDSEFVRVESGAARGA